MKHQRQSESNRFTLVLIDAKCRKAIRPNPCEVQLDRGAGGWTFIGNRIIGGWRYAE